MNKLFLKLVHKVRRKSPTKLDTLNLPIKKVKFSVKLAYFIRGIEDFFIETKKKYSKG